jgi:hypothetical protein
MTPLRVRSLAASVGTVLAATALLATGPVSAGTPTPYNANLVRNPGAQAGIPGTSVPRWEEDDGFEVIRYGDPGAPSKAHGDSFTGGTQLFSTGEYDTTFDLCPDALQFITISGRNRAIDAGNVRLRLKARLGTADPSHVASVTLQFRDGNNHAIGSLMTLGPVSTSNTLVARSRSRIVPRKARILRVQLQGGLEAPDCKAYFDKIDVRIVPD